MFHRLHQDLRYLLPGCASLNSLSVIGGWRENSIRSIITVSGPRKACLFSLRSTYHGVEVSKASMDPDNHSVLPIQVVGSLIARLYDYRQYRYYNLYVNIIRGRYPVSTRYGVHQYE